MYASVSMLDRNTEYFIAMRRSCWILLVTCLLICVHVVYIVLVEGLNIFLLRSVIKLITGWLILLIYELVF